VGLQSNAHSTREELREIRAGLGKALYQMKRVLSCPGRAGKWRSFLRERNIARATGDRLVVAHKKSLRPPNCVDDPIPESPEVAARRLVRHLWPRLRAIITAREVLYYFVRDVSTMAGESGRELRPDGVFVLRPLPEIVDSVPVIDVEAVEVASQYSEVI
jgi:hypothetical protein